MKKHWTEAVKAENKELRAEIADLKMQPMLGRFAKEIGNNIMVVLANMPFDRWPDLAKQAYKHAAEQQETTAYFYREHLPKA